MQLLIITEADVAEQILHTNASRLNSIDRSQIQVALNYCFRKQLGDTCPSVSSDLGNKWQRLLQKEWDFITWISNESYKLCITNIWAEILQDLRLLLSPSAGGYLADVVGKN
jgi:hypothetical protein